MKIPKYIYALIEIYDLNICGYYWKKQTEIIDVYLNHVSKNGGFKKIKHVNEYR